MVMGIKYNLLLIEDSVPMAHIYQEFLQAEPYKIKHVDTGEKALKALKKIKPDLILIEMTLPDMSALEFLTKYQRQDYQAPILVITPTPYIKLAEQALKQGAQDYLVRPFFADQLLHAIKEQLENTSLQNRTKAHNRLSSVLNKQGLIGSSYAIRSIAETIGNIAQSDAPTLIMGDAGTGKKLCANILHKKSNRYAQKALTINCAAIADEKLDAALCGLIQTTNTGSEQIYQGGFSLANGGTLILDQVCDLPIKVQDILIEFLLTKNFSKVGASKKETSNTRLICTSRKTLWPQVQLGLFRKELYALLQGVSLKLPDLSERENDAFEIAEFYLKKFNSEEDKSFTAFTKDAKEYILSQKWEGNITQLKNTIQNVILFQDSNKITAKMLCSPNTASSFPEEEEALYQTVTKKEDRTPQAQPSALSFGLGQEGLTEEDILPMSQIELQMIERALKITKGNVQKASSLLQLSPSLIHQRLKEKPTFKNNT